MHDILGQHSHWVKGKETDLQGRRHLFSYTLNQTRLTDMTHGCPARHMCVCVCVRDA